MKTIILLLAALAILAGGSGGQVDEKTKFAIGEDGIVSLSGLQASVFDEPYFMSMKPVDAVGSVYTPSIYAFLNSGKDLGKPINVSKPILYVGSVNPYL